MTLTTPFPPESLPLLWEWLNEFPENNFDDYGPNSLYEFTVAMAERAVMEHAWEVSDEAGPCGSIAYLPITPRLGTFHGICFAQRVHGSGIARHAVSQVIQELFDSGVRKIQAGFFSSNVRVHRFLSSLGAVDEGLLRKQTVRAGLAIDMQLVAFFKE